MVWDKDYDIAKKKAERIRNIINSAGFTCKEETWNAKESFESMMPGQVYSNYRSLPIMSYNLSHCVPLSSVWEGLRVNVHAGRISGSDLPHVTCSTHEGTPFFLNLNPGGDVFHAAVWGPTGAGKSTLLNLLEAQWYRYPNSQIVVFDKGRSCRQLCLACGGLFFEPAAETVAGVSFQPLRELETDRDMQDAMDFVESLFEVNGYTVDPPLRTAIKENLELLKDKPVEHRTITSLVHYANSYLNQETGKPLFKEALADYLWGGGKFGKIFDSSVSGLSLDTRYLVFEMEELMNRGEGATVPALVYLFNMVDKKFDGIKLSLLIIDEAWLFLKNETFSEKIAEWLKVLRKRNVGVVFATQDVADVVNSPLKTTITQQCLTKIYLADPSAYTDSMLPVYRAFGLTDTEIAYIANAQMKRDYFYTSPLGRRMFQLDLGRLTLGLIGAPNHKALDMLVAEKGSGIPLCKDILEANRINYKHLLRDDTPIEKPQPPKPVPLAAGQAPAHMFLPPLPVEPAAQPALFSSAASKVDAASIMDAVAALPDRRKKGEGRAAEELAEKLGISPSTVYQVRNILRFGSQELIDQVRSGRIGIKKASKRLKQKEMADS
jgi:type IV secretion system protein VirB4